MTMTAREIDNDNECYLIAKQELFPDVLLSDLTIVQFSDIIGRAQDIKTERAKERPLERGGHKGYIDQNGFTSPESEKP